ncbi:rhodanese-like domain-containing protein [bacterium]|nr:rhodanese-like domain-containing protein [bacterium]
MEQTRVIEQVAAADWQTWAENNGAVIIDVRDPVEWLQGTLPGSKTVQLMTLPQAMDQLDPSQAMLIVCRSGNRSQMAARFLSAHGFEKVANLGGGLKALGMAR